MREIIRKLGHLQVAILITLAVVISSEILAYTFAKIFSFSFLFPSAFIITFLVAAILTPIASWHLLGLLFSIDELEQKMKYLATYNAMTKTLTRQAFFEQSQKQHEKFQKEEKIYTVCIVDIDNFKSINDTYGHAGGDKVLTSFGQILNQVFTEKSIIGRIGGEEFALFINGDVNKTKAIIEELQETIAKSNILFENKNIKFTVSVGVYENNMLDTVSLEESLSLSDKALYHAKHTGKNKMVIFSDDLLKNNSTNIRHPN